MSEPKEKVLNERNSLMTVIENERKSSKVEQNDSLLRTVCDFLRFRS